MTNPDLTHRFTFHAPNEATRVKHEAVRAACLQLALDLDIALPDGREKALALTNLEQVMFWANAALARAKS